MMLEIIIIKPVIINLILFIDMQTLNALTLNTAAGWDALVGLLPESKFRSFFLDTSGLSGYAENVGDENLGEVIVKSGFQYVRGSDWDLFNVITSYSIHYTKLYEPRWPRRTGCSSWAWTRSSASRGSARRWS